MISHEVIAAHDLASVRSPIGSPFCVYVMWSQDRDLLYIGYSKNLRERLLAHRRKTPWWPQVAEIERWAFTTRNEAWHAEAVAILRYSPRYNVERRQP